MVELPIEVQAALDAYLAARVDDTTWEAYVHSLGPGVALDVATELCGHVVEDAGAAARLTLCLFADSEEEEPEDRAPLGVDAHSGNLSTLLGDIAVSGRASITLSYLWGYPRQWPPVAWTAVFAGDHWKSEGCVTNAERDAWRAAEAIAEAAGGSRLAVPWTVALCRAICLAWSPEWARSQEQS